MPAALDRLIRRLDPDPAPEPPGYTNPNQPPPVDPDCICRNLDGIGQNPTCLVHPWWRHDDDALDLADLTRELGSALAAAQQKFGGSA
jgi:hypothetical protein